MDIIYKKKKESKPMQLYESNYALLTRLAPRVDLIEFQSTSSIEGEMDLFLQIDGHDRYTTTLLLTHFLDIKGRLIPDPHMKIRLYHDAKVAEVLSFQHQPDVWECLPCLQSWRALTVEKKNVNQFLLEWLRFCLSRGHRFTIDNKSIPS